MKHKKLKLLTFFLFLLPLSIIFFGAGCEKDEASQSGLNGKWILLGFGNDSTGEYTSEPDSEPKSSYVIFDNGQMVAHSVSNVIENVKYVVDKEHEITFSTHGMRTLIGGDTDWGKQFLNLIIKIDKFQIEKNELKLYYENQNYMKFEKEIK